jgi:hypothetical protein
VTLRTRSYREAEHRAALLDQVFGDAVRRARAFMTDTADLNLLLRARLQEFLADDLQRRMERPVGAPVYAYWWKHGDPGTAIDADLEAIRQARDSLKRDLARNSPKEMEEYAEELIRKHQLPESLLRPLTYGLIEAAISGWETAERRTLGIEPLIFAPSTETAQTPEPGCSSRQPQLADPLASSLVEAFGQ